jgi:hypothetical protein
VRRWSVVPFCRTYEVCTFKEFVANLVCLAFCGASSPWEVGAVTLLGSFRPLLFSYFYSALVCSHHAFTPLFHVLLCRYPLPWTRPKRSPSRIRSCLSTVTATDAARDEHRSTHFWRLSIGCFESALARCTRQWARSRTDCSWRLESHFRLEWWSGKFVLRTCRSLEPIARARDCETLASQELQHDVRSRTISLKVGSIANRNDVLAPALLGGLEGENAAWTKIQI